MGERLTVEIVGRDGVSRVFTAISSEATKTGKAVEGAGKTGSKSLKEMDAQAKTASTSMETLEKRSQAVGAAIGTLAGGVAVLGRNNRDAKLQVDAISRAYGDQSDLMLDLTERVQDYSRFSNDSAREAALTFQTLTENYGYSIEQLDQLMIRSADVAQLRGRTIEEVAAMLQAAARGEAEYAEAIGITANDTYLAAEYAARGLGNWNTLTDDAAKAQFRFQVIMEQTAYASGAAGDAVQDAGGKFRQFLNDTDDAGEAIGAFLGPVGEVAAELAPVAIALPVVGAGLGNVRAALSGTAAAGRAASLGLGAVSVLTSPVALGLAAVAGSALLAYKYFDNLDARSRNLAQSLGVLDELIENLKLGGEEGLAAQAQETVDAFEAIITQLSGASFDEIVQKLGLPEGTTFLDISGPGGLNDQLAMASDSMDEFAAKVLMTVQQIGPEASAAYLAWVNDLLATVEHTAEGTNLDEILTTIITTPASEVPGVMDAVTESTTSATMALAAMAAIAPLVGDGLANIRSDGQRLADSLLTGVVAGTEAAIEAHQNHLTALENFNTGIDSFLSSGGNVLDFWLQYQELANQGAAAFRGTEEEYRAWLDAMNEKAEFRALVQLSSDLDAANQSFDQVLRTFSQIDSLGSRSSSAGSIAEALVGTPGEWAAIDDLLESGRISLEQYQSTVQSGYAIQQSAADQAMILNEIRADQIPLLEQETLAYQQNLEAIAAMEPIEQRRALMLQDSAVQSKIASDYALAYSASVGEIPQEVATSVILQSAEADAGLMDLYLQMGLIEEVWVDGEKTLRVNFPDGPTVQEAVMGLTESIDRLYVLLGGDPLMLNIGVNDEATPVIDQVLVDLSNADGATTQVWALGDGTHATGMINEVTGELITLDGSTATVVANAQDNASATLGYVQSLLNGLDGRIINTYVNTTYSGREVGPGMAHGGIAGYAMGGNVVPIWASENGTELAHFPTGGVVPLYGEGVHHVPVGSYIETAPSARSSLGGITVGPIIIQGNVIRENDMILTVADHVSRSLQQMLEDQQAGVPRVS